MSEEDKKLQKHLVDEMMKVSETNPDVMFYMEALMKKYEELEQKVKQLEKRNKEIYDGFKATTDELCEATKKVEQLEKENKELKQPQLFIDCEDMEERYGRDLYEDYLKGKIEQLESIRKEAIEYINKPRYVPLHNSCIEIEEVNKEFRDLLNILNKGSE